MSSAIKTPAFQAKAGNIQNEDGSSIYSGGEWSFKNASAVTGFHIASDGNVGIGTTSPGVALNSVGSATFGSNPNGIALFQASKITTSDAGVLFGSENGNLPYIAATKLNNGTGSATDLAFRTNGTERMRIAADGTVSASRLLANNTFSVGLTPQSNRIKIATSILNGVSNTHYLTYNANDGLVGYGSSSRLLKDNITPISYGLDAVLALNPCNFTMHGDNKVGFIADEVEQVVPELVAHAAKSTITNKEEDTEMIPVSVHYPEITAVLCKAIQEQQAMIEELKAKVSALESK